MKRLRFWHEFDPGIRPGAVFFRNFMIPVRFFVANSDGIRCQGKAKGRSSIRPRDLRSSFDVPCGRQGTTHSPRAVPRHKPNCTTRSGSCKSTPSPAKRARVPGKLQFNGHYDAGRLLFGRRREAVVQTWGMLWRRTIQNHPISGRVIIRMTSILLTFLITI